MRSIVPLVLAGALVGCKCAGPPIEVSELPQNQEDAGRAAETAQQNETTAKKSTPDQYWISGKLPPSVVEGTPIPGGTLVIRATNDPQTLTPHLFDPVGLDSMRIALGRIYDTLLYADKDDAQQSRLLPGAAESYEESNDHRTFIFNLRKGMRFHDGRPVTARDVATTLKKMLESRDLIGVPHGNLAEVKEFKALDDLTFKVVLERPNNFFFRQIATGMAIMPRHVIERGDFRKNTIHRFPVGSGPWKFESWAPWEEVALERNEDYWGKKPFVKRLVFRIVREPFVAAQLFERGEFDLMQQIPYSFWLEMERNSRFVEQYHRIRFYSKNYEWVGWNQERPLFADKRVRKAMALLFDRESFDRTMLHGLEKPTTCHFLLDSDECDPAIKPLPFDPKLARELLRAAGWEDRDGDGVLDRGAEKFRFTFLAPSGSAFFSKLTAALKDSYKKAGIQMEVQRVDARILSRRLRKHDFDACGMLWADADGGSDPFRIWHSSQAKQGFNYVGFRNVRADEILDQARLETERAKRSALFRELGSILYEEQPYMWLNVRPELDAINKRVKGVRPSLSWYNLEQVWLEGPDSENRR